MVFKISYQALNRSLKMAEAERKLSGGKSFIDFQTAPEQYKHWKLSTEGEIATLAMDVNEEGGLFEGYQLKLNSYDLGVDIELADAWQRIRFEHPQVKTVVMRSNKPKVFCAGANIRMLAGSEHAHKVNFCKFTNETRNNFEEAAEVSGLKSICVVSGTAAGGGYELALATDYILLVDDGNSSVSLPEVPLLAVLPGTGGLTRVIDKRKVRRDHADVFCTVEEGIKGKRAKEWRLVDDTVSATKLEDKIQTVAREFAANSPRNGTKGLKLTPLTRTVTKTLLTYKNVTVEIDSEKRIATFTLKSGAAAPANMEMVDASFWGLEAYRELDDAILHLRNNEFEVGTWIFKTVGDAASVLSCDALLENNKTHWLANEILAFQKRVLKRLDVTSRTLITLIEPASCFAGSLAEIAFASDRIYMLEGQFQGDNRAPASITLNNGNFGAFPMGNGLTRLETRFYGEPASVDKAKAYIGESLEAAQADKLGLVTYALDDIDWADEIRIFLQERTSYSPDGLTGMEANLRFTGPETMESKIFSRLTAWQNWIFQRPNAVSLEGALRKYGTGERPVYDMKRV
jgi:benzoyl-CoA-dihydrodiol lyase